MAVLNISGQQNKSKTAGSKATGLQVGHLHSPSRGQTCQRSCAADLHRQQGHHCLYRYIQLCLLLRVCLGQIWFIDELFTHVFMLSYVRTPSLRTSVQHQFQGD